MCGLVGIAGKLQYADEKVMQRLLVHDYWRGKDSTGFASIRATDQMASIAKIASHPFDLFDMTRFKSASNGATSSVFIGHNRAATKGVVNAYNAHPFHFGSIVGAHNGTLAASSHKALEDAIGEKFEVDSQALICAIDKLGIEETIKLCEGAWAITYYDGSDNTLNFIRNDQRPLWYAYSDDFKKVLWASEFWMIRAACETEGLKLATIESNDKSYQFLGVEKDWLYSFDLTKMRETGTTERPKPKVHELKGKEAAKVEDDPFGRAGGRTTYGTLMSQTAGTANGSNISTMADFRPKQSRKIKKVSEIPIDQRQVHLIGSTRDPLANMMTPDEFAYMTKYGCSWCKKPISLDAVGVTLYLRDQIVTCPDCSPVKGAEEHNRIYVQNLKDYL